MQFKLPGFTLDLLPLLDKQPGVTPKDLGQIGFAALSKKLEGRFENEIGFFNWPTEKNRVAAEKSESIAKALRAKYEGVVIFGIGGSYLGPAVVTEGLGARGNFEIHWVSNIDAPEITKIEAVLQKKKMAAVVISKSGGTVETMGAFFHLSKYFADEAIIAVTDPKVGELRRLATAQKWQSLEVPSNIGGRFSVLTPVGLLPVALAGLSADHLFEGAAEMRDVLVSTPAEKNPAYLLGALLHLWDVRFSHGFQYVMPYRKNLLPFAQWCVQLLGESLGKKTVEKKNAVGPTPGAALGTSDQHSLLQLFKEGPNNKVIGFLDVVENLTSVQIAKPAFETRGLDYLFGRGFDEIQHNASLATQQSLTNAGVPTYRLDVEKLDEHTLGALFFLYETACAFAGELYGVEAFDQPGVEESKILLKQRLMAPR